MENKSFKSGIRGIKYENSSDTIKDMPLNTKLELRYGEAKEFPNSVSIFYIDKRLGFIAKEMALVMNERIKRGYNYECILIKKDTFEDNGITYNGGFVLIEEVQK